MALTKAVYDGMTGKQATVEMTAEEEAEHRAHQAAATAREAGARAGREAAAAQRVADLTAIRDHPALDEAYKAALLRLTSP